MNNKTKNISLTIVFLIIIFGMFFINLISKDKEMSESERRKLAKFPDVSFSKITSGSFSDAFEKYGADQFVFRDNFRTIKTSFHLNILRQKDSNGYFIKDGIIYKQQYPLNENSVLNVVNQIKEIQETYLNETNKIYYSIVPDKNYFLEESTDYLKMDYEKLEQIMNENLQDLQYINLFDTLTIDDYYKTDTHWKQENIIKVAEKLGQEMNFYVDTNVNIKSKGDFYGVYYGQMALEGNPDELKYVENKEINNAKVYELKQEEAKDVYNEEGINSLDKYTYYLYGSVPLLTIKNDLAKNDKHLVIFRDSFGSSLTPLLISGYSKIDVVDTRYISKKLLKDYINFENCDILFAYSTLLINDSSTLK